MSRQGRVADASGQGHRRDLALQRNTRGNLNVGVESMTWASDLGIECCHGKGLRNLMMPFVHQGDDSISKTHVVHEQEDSERVGWRPFPRRRLARRRGDIPVAGGIARTAVPVVGQG